MSVDFGRRKVAQAEENAARFGIRRFVAVFAAVIRFRESLRENFSES